MPERVTRLVLTMGDPAGIGPEIALKALRRLGPGLPAAGLDLAVAGTRACLERAAAALGLAVDWTDGTKPGSVWPRVGVIEATDQRAPVPIATASAEAGRLAYHAVAAAVRQALDGAADGIVTGPISKEALNMAGYAYAGHTEMLAELTGARDSVLMLAHDGMHVSHVSAHTALANVPARVTPERVRRVIELTHGTLVELGYAAPRIAVAALNPHAGEGGLFGREDLDITAPVVGACRAAGLRVDGPVPGDTVFIKMRAGQYDAVVAMYHDQGHIPVKLLGFKVDPATGRWLALSGVNITLGLPIIRSSVDHGTAFDIAGQGIAQESSMVEAVEFAARLAAARRGRGS